MTIGIKLSCNGGPSVLRKAVINEKVRTTFMARIAEGIERVTRDTSFDQEIPRLEAIAEPSKNTWRTSGSSL